MPNQGLEVMEGRMEVPTPRWEACFHLITMGEINSLLATSLPDTPIKVTTRAFRPALPTLLAREGVTEQVLQALGRWTSKSYNHYVRKGRSGDWRGQVVKIKYLSI